MGVSAGVMPLPALSRSPASASAPSGLIVRG